MTMTVESIPRPLYRVLQKITHEPRIDVALSIAVLTTPMGGTIHPFNNPNNPVRLSRPMNFVEFLATIEQNF